MTHSSVDSHVEFVTESCMEFVTHSFEGSSWMIHIRVCDSSMCGFTCGVRDQIMYAYSFDRSLWLISMWIHMESS